MQEKVKYILRLLIIILLNICVIGIVGSACITVAQSFREKSTVQVLSKIGSQGDEVRAVQQKLQELGFYTGEVDGVFGSGTATAVKEFQRSRGLTVDGVVGSATLNALGLGGSGNPGSSSETDYQLLARVISAEARGESHTGQVAVGAVILNRVQHPSFPDTLAGVVYQPGEFSVMDNGQINQPVAESAYRAATEALNGSDPTGGAIYYYNPSKTSNQWLRTRPVLKRIGNHLFCA